MKTALFIPCYIDQFFPQVGIAALSLLESLGCVVEYPRDQTCCGQPMANSGMEKSAVPVYQHYVNNFSHYDFIVAPSASCVYHVQHHYDILPQTSQVSKVRENTIDICTFLLDVLQIKSLNAYFPYRIGIHQSCHGLRGLRMAKSSELVIEPYSQWRKLLEMVEGIKIAELERPDECCGFGGTFSIQESAVSVKMGLDRITDHEKNKVEFITSGDMSCLMHLNGIIKYQKKNIGIKHLVEILVSQRNQELKV